MALLNGLPVFKIKFNEDLDDRSGIGFISTVDYPAIETDWIAMGNDKSPLKFSTVPDKQILYGPILIPDKPIYRYDEKSRMEYWVVFPKDVVEKLVRKFQAQQKTINLNYQHQKDSQIAKAVIQEIWLTGKTDKAQDLGFELPEGSAMVGAYMGDKEFWESEVKTKNVRGFSIEGFLDMEMRSIKNQNMNEQKFITAKTDKGIEIKSDAEAFALGVEIYTEVDGVKAPVADGEHTLDNGTMITVVGSKITEMMEEELDAAQIEVIQKANQPKLAELEAKLEARIKELETKLANTPGALSATSNTDETPRTPVKQSVKVQLTSKLSILRKKSEEVKS